MRVQRAFLVSCICLISASPTIFAQQQAPANVAPGEKQTFMVQDGGVSQRLHSLFVPPKPDAPFTLTLQTEWQRTLYDGGTITLVNERKIARDSKGRIYQERWTLVPKNGTTQSAITMIQISDPTTHTLYNCAQDNRHECQKLDYEWSTSAEYKEDDPPTGELPGGRGHVMRDDLGTQLLEGVEAVGTRISTIYNPGVFGNDREVTVERESWFSAQLGINLLSVRNDPRFGKQTFTVTNLILAEPDAKLFELPEGFKVTNTREPAQ